MTSHAENDDISHADLSATQRDLLWALSQTDTSESRPLHHTLTDYYTDSISHSRICNTLRELIKRDLVTKQTHDTTQYQLTESGHRALSARQAWQADTHHAEGKNE